MTNEHRSLKDLWARVRRRGPWLALPLVAVVAFAVGTCAGSGTSTHEHPKADAAQGEQGGEAQVWTCSMHPQVRQEQPGQCPICGMDLIPASSEDEEQDPKRITLSERAKTLARIRTTEVERRGRPGAERHLLGRLDYDETRRKTVTAWTGGRIDRLHVEVTGEKVRRGQVIATVYSPEIYSAHRDLLAATQQRERIAKHGTESGVASAETAVKAARQRLRLLGVPDREIERMAGADEPWRHVPIRSPFGGTILERKASEGEYIDTGTPLYKLADLGQLWVQLDAYESDLPLLSEGQKVDVEVKALPGETFEGQVAFIDPVVDPKTRTTQVRIEVPNPEGRLRPGMFAEAVVQGDAPRAGERPLVIPRSAPLFTGRRSVVYVEVPKAKRPTYEMRVVKLGTRTGDVYPVLAGLQAGERVVTRGAFVLDADLQIRGGVSMMSVPDDTEKGPYDEVVPLPDSAGAELGRVLNQYLKLQERLAADDLSGAKQAANAMLAAVRNVEIREPERSKRAWRTIASAMLKHEAQVASAGAMQDLRSAFAPLSEQVKQLLQSFGNPLERPVRVAHCPMAFDGRGADWVQARKEIDNSYFGSKMRTCGEIKSTVQPGSYLTASIHAPRNGGKKGHSH
jgi:Cu(I)/Ag(I) efflux system membrane fusion protein